MVVELEKRLDLADICGQDRGKRVLEIAAAGGHHLALIGPTGCGRSTLAAALAALLPEPSAVEQDEIIQLHRAMGRPWPADSVAARPVIAPSAAVKPATLLGASGRQRVGDLALANHGLVIVDDADRFLPRALDAVREALDRGVVGSAADHTHPSRFQLVVTAHTSPCKPCHACDDPFDCELRHLRPSLARFIDIVDLQALLDPPTPTDWCFEGRVESTSEVRARVLSARRKQARRGVLNRDLPWPTLVRTGTFAPEAMSLLDQATTAQLHTARDRIAVLRVARTLADLESRDEIQRKHVAEALIYRLLPARMYRRKRKPSDELNWMELLNRDGRRSG